LNPFLKASIYTAIFSWKLKSSTRSIKSYTFLHIFRLVNKKNEHGLPIQQLPPNLNIIGGGFFIIDESMIEWWKNTYDTKLKLYFDNGYLVKDDQTIITDCIFSNMSMFSIHTEENNKYDRWFLFQRLLL
jgi:hypothetical protein